MRLHGGGPSNRLSAPTVCPRPSAFVAGAVLLAILLPPLVRVAFAEGPLAGREQTPVVHGDDNVVLVRLR